LPQVSYFRHASLKNFNLTEEEVKIRPVGGTGGELPSR
jgi:hypothetical protein